MDQNFYKQISIIRQKNEHTYIATLYDKKNLIRVAWFI